MSYEDDGDMYTAVDMSQKKRNNSSSPVAASYKNDELSSDSMPMHAMAKPVPPKPPPFESTYNTLNHSTRPDSPMNVKVKGVVKNPIKFKLARYHVVILIIALVMMAALVLCLILSFVAIAGNSVLKQQLSDSNTMLQQLNESNTMLQQKLATLHNQTQKLSDFNTSSPQLVHFHFTLHPPVLLDSRLLCLPPPPQATIGSGPPMALL